MSVSQYSIAFLKKTQYYVAAKPTFLFSDEMLNNDISHAVSVGIAIHVETVNCTEDKLVAGNGPILAAQHLLKR